MSTPRAIQMKMRFSCHTNTKLSRAVASGHFQIPSHRCPRGSTAFLPGFDGVQLIVRFLQVNDSKGISSETKSAVWNDRSRATRSLVTSDWTGRVRFTDWLLADL